MSEDDHKVISIAEAKRERQLQKKLLVRLHAIAVDEDVVEISRLVQGVFENDERIFIQVRLPQEHSDGWALTPEQSILLAKELFKKGVLARRIMKEQSNERR